MVLAAAALRQATALALALARRQRSALAAALLRQAVALVLALALARRQRSALAAALRQAVVLALALALARRQRSALEVALRQAVALALALALARRRGSALARRRGSALAQAMGSEAVLGRRPRLVPVYPRLEEASAAWGRARPPPAEAFKWGRKARHEGAGQAKAGAEQQAMMKTEVRCFRRGIDRPSASLGMSHELVLVLTLCTCRPCVLCACGSVLGQPGETSDPSQLSVESLPHPTSDPEARSPRPSSGVWDLGRDAPGSRTRSRSTGNSRKTVIYLFLSKSNTFKSMSRNSAKLKLIR